MGATISNPRFAPITSALLVRKGDAVPSALMARAEFSRPREPLAPAAGVALTKPTFAFGTRSTAPAESPALRNPLTEGVLDAALAIAAETEPAAATPAASAPEAPPEPAVAPPPPIVAAVSVRTSEPRKAAAFPEQPKPHRLMVTLSHEEYERLGIAAVKKNTTRHQLVRDGFELHMKKLMREYAGCGCMTGGAGRCSDSCAH